MTQDEKWMIRYNEIVDFINTNHRNPSKHRFEEHNMLSWIKQQRKLIKAGTFKSERMEMFWILQALMEGYKCKNQYE